MELLVYITVPDQDNAYKLAKGLVEAGLAAGVNITGPAHSIYRWQGEIHENLEWQLFAQTHSDKFDSFLAYVQPRHPHRVPCIIAMELKNGNKDFLAWIRN